MPTAIPARAASATYVQPKSLPSTQRLRRGCGGPRSPYKMDPLMLTLSRQYISTTLTNSTSSGAVLNISNCEQGHHVTDTSREAQRKEMKQRERGMRQEKKEWKERERETEREKGEGEIEYKCSERADKFIEQLLNKNFTHSWSQPHKKQPPWELKPIKKKNSCYIGYNYNRLLGHGSRRCTLKQKFHAACKHV